VYDFPSPGIPRRSNIGTKNPRMPAGQPIRPLAADLNGRNINRRNLNLQICNLNLQIGVVIE